MLSPGRGVDWESVPDGLVIRVRPPTPPSRQMILAGLLIGVAFLIAWEILPSLSGWAGFAVLVSVRAARGDPHGWFYRIPAARPRHR